MSAPLATTPTRQCSCGRALGRYDARCVACLADAFDRRPFCPRCDLRRADANAEIGPHAGKPVCSACWVAIHVPTLEVP